MAKRDITQNKAYQDRQNNNSSSNSNTNFFDRFNPEAGGIIGSQSDHLGSYATQYPGYDGPVGSNGQPTITPQQYGNFLNTGKRVSPITPQSIAMATPSPFGNAPTNAAMYSPTSYTPRPVRRTPGSVNVMNPFKKKEEEQQQIINQPVVDKINPVNKITPESELTNKFGVDTKGWTGEQYNQRNDRIAYDLIGGGVQNEQGVRNNLMQYGSFKNATAQEQNNTIQEILGRIGSQNARTGEVDQIAQQIGYKDFRDFSAKAGSAVAGQVNSLINDIQSYKAQGDVTGESYARAALADVMAEGKNLQVEEGIRNTDTLVSLSKMNPQAAGVIEQYNLVQNLMGQGIAYQDLPKYIGKDQQYIDKLLGGEWNKLGVQLTPEMESEVFAKMKLDKEQLDMDNTKKQEQLALQMERNTQDFLKAADRQRADNQVQKDNMSKLARMTGVGYSSAGVEGMDRVFDQGRQALQDLQDLHSRSSYDLQKQLADVSDAYIYNTKVYDLSYKDSMKNITNSFMQDVQQIQGRFGKNSAAALDNITKTTTTYMTNLAELGMFREKQQADLNNDLRSRKKDAANLDLDQQRLDLQRGQLQNRQGQQDIENRGKYPGLFGTPGQISSIAGLEKGATFVNKIVNNQTNGNRNQCGEVTNDYLANTGAVGGGKVGNSLQSKIDTINTYTPTVGSVMIMDSPTKSQYGHTAIVTGIGPDGTLYMTDGNGFGAGTGKVGTFTTKVDNGKFIIGGKVQGNVYGFNDPLKGKEQTLTPTDYAKFSNSTFKPQTDLKNSSDTAKYEKYIQEKDKVMNDPNSRIEDVLKMSSGGGNISDTSIQKLDKYSSVLSQLGDIEKSISKFKNGGPIMGILSSKNPYDTKAQALNAQLTAIVPALARGVYGEVGVLTDNDVKLYQQTIPNLKQTKDVQNAVMAMTLKVVQRGMESSLKIQAMAGKDVSSFVGELKNIQNKVATIEKSLGIQPSTGTNSGTPPTIVNKYKSR